MSISDRPKLASEFASSFKLFWDSNQTFFESLREIGEGPLKSSSTMWTFSSSSSSTSISSCYEIWSISFSTIVSSCSSCWGGGGLRCISAVSGFSSSGQSTWMSSACVSVTVSMPVCSGMSIQTASFFSSSSNLSEWRSSSFEYASSLLLVSAY